jgi:hypothetical protein
MPFARAGIFHARGVNEAKRAKVHEFKEEFPRVPDRASDWPRYSGFAQC